MQSLEDRVKQLEADNARVMEAIKIAAGHLASIALTATLREVIDAIRSAAGQLRRLIK
jgi:hypothetical protein